VGYKQTPLAACRATGRWSTAFSRSENYALARDAGLTERAEDRSRLKLRPKEVITMTDADARGLVLKHLYDLRDQGEDGWLDSRGDFDGIGVEQESLPRLVGFLAQEGYVEWHHPKGTTEVFRARITARGANVMEGKEKASPSVAVDLSTHVHSSYGVQIGGQGNVQTVSFDVEKLINAADNSAVSVTEREQAKSLLRQIAENPLVQKLLGILIKA
jgi:hypothetical protein